MKFTKMHGLGNDYIFLDCTSRMPEDPERLARVLSNRHFGVGGDGIICVCRAAEGDFRMRMFNADGSEGAMCGNGIRCLGKYVYDNGLTDKKRLDIETAAGMRTIELQVSAEKVVSVSVDMGVAVIGAMAKIYVNGKCFTGIDASMGNDHFVIPVLSVEEMDVSLIGRAVEQHPRFDDGVNVEFVRPICQNRMVMRVWERGSGETMACGTGACAAVAVMHSLGRLEQSVTVLLPGGELEVFLRERDGHMIMSGPAESVFEGDVYPRYGNDK